MTNVFIIHGICGCPEENWFPWLKKELESLGHNVFVPGFPNPKHPKLIGWLEFFDKYQDNLREDSVVVGHSLSVSFLLRILEEHPAKAAFFVAGFTGVMKNEFAEDMPIAVATTSGHAWITSLKGLFPHPFPQASLKDGLPPSK